MIEPSERAAYTASVEWRSRLARWFEHERRCGVVRCRVCGARGGEESLELHHHDYTRVLRDEYGRWLAGERHDDLTAVHPRCHRWIHRVIAEDETLSTLVSPRSASVQAIVRLRGLVIRGVAAG